MAAVGAVILGLSREAAGRYDESLPFWITKDTVPALMLFVVLLVVPQEKASVFRDQPDRSSVPDTRWRTVLLGSLALVAVAFVLPSVLDGGTLDAVGYGVALSIVGLSLVPLTGLAGQINLAPLAFAGIGAVVMYQWGSDGNPLALVAVVVVCAVVGALVALPALRLKGLYLALSTFAFALFCEKAIFPNVDEFSQGDAAYERLHLGPWTTASDRANLVLLAVVFALLGIGVTAVRRGSIGRRLQAMKDSPAACATMGLDLTALKLQVFALSAAIAGLGGALLGGWRGKVGTEQFSLLAGALPGLPLVLLTVVGGIAAVSGALLGGVALAMFPEIAEAVPALANLMTVLPGLAGISLAANPDGAVAQTVARTRAAVERLRGHGPPGDSAGARALGMLAPPSATSVPERIAVGASAAGADVAVLDDETGLSWGRCHVDP
jgi:branched-chain amino acid transport system permease protein